jgi:hypothetical protein
MTRIQLRLYTDPGEVQIFCNLLRNDGNQETITATIDTGASISLFPRELLDIIAYRTTERGTVVIEQAGIADHSFQAIEAFVRIAFEDMLGNMTQPFEIRAWFADTTTRLIGFEGVLDQYVLHIDMLRLEGWLEINR